MADARRLSARPAFVTADIVKVLKACTQDQKLTRFYNEPKLQIIANGLAVRRSVKIIQDKWDLGNSHALAMSKLSLYDVVFLLDDSLSMAIHEERRQQAEEIIGLATCSTTLFDSNGIDIRCINGSDRPSSFTDAKKAGEYVINNVKYDAKETPLGRSMHQLLDEFVWSPIKKGQFEKPVLVICITDGLPTHDDPPKSHKRGIGYIDEVLIKNRQILLHNRFSEGAVSFMLA